MSEADEDCIVFDSSINFIQPTNGKHWFNKIKQIFRRRSSLPSSSQFRNSIFERSSSSMSYTRAEERLCKELRYFFMNPCQKYKAKKRKPFKLAIQLFKIILVTLQLIIFGGSNQALMDFKNESTEVFQNVFLNESTSFYTKTDIYNHINFIRYQYANFENITLGSYGYSKLPCKECNETHENLSGKKNNKYTSFCVDEYMIFENDLNHDHLVIKASGVKRRCFCLDSWSYNEKLMSNNHSLPLQNGSFYHINFSRMNTLQVMFGLETVRIMSNSYRPVDCYEIEVLATFSNDAHTGKIALSLDTNFILSLCPNVNTSETKLVHKPVFVLLLVLDVTIILHCSASSLLCIRSLWRGQRLRKSFERFYCKRYRKKLQWFVKLEFFNMWYFLIIISDILTILGSICKVYYEMQLDGEINYELCSLFLGVGCLCVWIGVLRYAGFFHQYNILVLTLKKAIPHVLRFMVCASVMYLGFLFCGWVVLGPYHSKFRNPVVASEALFSLINGDDMYMTYEEMSKKSVLAYTFCQIYLYIFISLFIYIVLSLFISVIMDTYETIKDWQRDDFPPQNEIQRYLADHTDPDMEIQYDYNSDTYCCFCLYHNNDPDIECYSVDEDNDELNEME